jgi:hypothetical protein
MLQSPLKSCHDINETQKQQAPAFRARLLCTAAMLLLLLLLRQSVEHLNSAWCPNSAAAGRPSISPSVSCPHPTTGEPTVSQTPLTHCHALLRRRCCCCGKLFSTSAALGGPRVTAGSTDALLLLLLLLLLLC